MITDSSEFKILQDELVTETVPDCLDVLNSCNLRLVNSLVGNSGFEFDSIKTTDNYQSLKSELENCFNRNDALTIALVS